MMELFPWEERQPASDPTMDRAEEPGEPAEIEPELQPDGDPRELEDTEAESGEETATPAQPRPPEETETPPHGDPLRAGEPGASSPSGAAQPARVPDAGRAQRPVARKEYYSIGEVSDLVGLPAHVLRYWESQFTVLNPSKNRSGNRAYQRKEIKLILLVKHLLYEEKYTVEGAKAKLDQLRRGGALAERTAAALDAQAVRLLRDDVAALRALIAEPV